MPKKKVTATVYSRYSAGTLVKALVHGGTYSTEKLFWFICSESQHKQFCHKENSPGCRGKCKKFTITVEEADEKD